MNTIIEITGEIELEYDENTNEFKEALEAYQKSIDPNGKKEDILKHVAFHVTRFGIESMVEGVGYVAFGSNKIEEPFSGITVKKNYDEFDFEIK